MSKVLIDGEDVKKLQNYFRDIGITFNPDEGKLTNSKSDSLFSIN